MDPSDVRRDWVAIVVDAYVDQLCDVPDELRTQALATVRDLALALVAVRDAMTPKPTAASLTIRSPPQCVERRRAGLDAHIRRAREALGREDWIRLADVYGHSSAISVARESGLFAALERGEVDGLRLERRRLNATGRPTYILCRDEAPIPDEPDAKPAVYRAMLETLRDRLQDSHEVPVNEALGAFGSRPLEIAKQCGLLDDLERGGSGGVRVERRRGHLPEGVPRVVAVRVADPSTPFPRSA